MHTDLTCSASLRVAASIPSIGQVLRPRIILSLVFGPEEERIERSGYVKTLKHWLDPISKRVILIFINGLNENFLSRNSTPYMQEILNNYGAFAVGLTPLLQTNHKGIMAVLRGRNIPTFPFSWWVNANASDHLLARVAHSCAMGSLPPELLRSCYFLDMDPFENFHKFPGLFEVTSWKKSLYVMSLDLDPILVRDYESRLRKVDEDIRLFATMVDSFHGENTTTYIVTSARGSPVGESLHTNVPVVAWGKGIQYSGTTTFIRQTDLTAMLCALLGLDFPSGLFGVIPMNMMTLRDHYEFELILYTIRHFERVLEAVDLTDHLYDSSELELEQLSKRLEHIILEIRRTKLRKWTWNCCVLCLLLVILGVNLVSFAFCGFACFLWNLKTLFLLVVVVGTTLTYSLLGLELLVALELLLFCTWQNNKQICKTFSKNFGVIMEAVFTMFIVVTVVSWIGNHSAVPVMLGLVILWPVINGSYVRLNRLVLFTHLVSGVALGILPLNRVFGEMPDVLVITCVSGLLLVNFYFLMTLFEGEFDTHMKVNFVVILATTTHVCCIREYKLLWLRDTLSCLFLSFSFLSVYAASGTLLEKLFKILLPLFIPVLMLTIRLECIFYLSIIFHMFTWIFTSYHSSNSIQYQFYPAIFSIEAEKPLKTVCFSDEDTYYVIFFLVYNYVSYLAIGNFPDLYAYDLYVVPTFIFQYPHVVSYFLGGFKFFLPFFVITTSFVALCLVKKKNFKPLIVMSFWLSDFMGCFLILHSELTTPFLRSTGFSAKFSYFIIQQFIMVSVILSYFIGKHLLLDSERFWSKLFPKRSRELQLSY